MDRLMDLPLTLPRSSFVEAAGALEREWLVTNGLGGFASGTVAQANTRRYHGLLVASLRPPVERIVMLAKLDATARYQGASFALAANEFGDGTLAPRGFELLASFELDGQTPVWTWQLADALLEQRIWMAPGENTTFVSFTARGGWQLATEPEAQGVRVTAFAGARPYRLSIDRGGFTPAPDWYWSFFHRIEAERGLDAHEDLFRPGVFRLSLAPGETAIFGATAEASPAAPSIAHERERQTALLRTAPADAPEWVRRLTLAADQFVVARVDSRGAKTGTTVIAGYPWFGDWGRDTMIALPGLALATGRHQDAAAILRTFAASLSEGMLPNRFPDYGEPPEYNTVDATLWYFHAIDAYLQATGDTALLRELYPALRDIIEWHRRGTRYGIRLDPTDGLLFAGEPGVQLTWMDAKVGDWVVTPRIGKPVEINALWHFALERMTAWAKSLKDSRAGADYAAATRRAAASFRDRFWYAEGSYLYDVIDGPEGSLEAAGRRVDASMRPNQLFAVSLGAELLDRQRARAVVDACGRELLTPVGLRSLSPRDPQYVGRYGGGPRERDGAYHQGTVWSWLLGPYALAHYRVHRDAAHALALLEGIAPHLGEACLGQISEIFDAGTPHRPQGCFAQAWSVAESLRAWKEINRD
jgi:predicted glycogen debranching enzyme